MIIRKFTGKSEEEVSEAAKKELGEGFVIMNIKHVKPKGAFSFFRKKQVELTAAKEDDEEPIRQIRKIAQAQVAAQEKAASQKSSFDVKVGDDTDTHSVKADAAAKAVADAGNRTGIGPSETKSLINFGESGSSSIEKKLDNLQSLLETQISRENAVIGAAKENADKVSKAAGSQESGDKTEKGKDKKEEIEEQEKEVDRFMRLLYNTMIENEVDDKYAAEIISEAEKYKKPGISMDYILGNIYQKMILKFGKSDGITPSAKGPRIVFFIGPTGV